jgi:methionyl-tRNA formyltransferase
MNIIFFGSSSFSVLSLDALLKSGCKVSLVVTQPDKKKGRGLHLGATAVKDRSIQLGLPVFQPECVNSVQSLNVLRDLKPDLFVVIAYGQILSRDVLSIPGIFCLNAHASLLPKYRGAAPINWALIRGDKLTGVSIIKMIDKMDAGPVLSSKEVPIDDDDTVISLDDKLRIEAAGLLVEAVGLIEKNDYELTPQDEQGLTYAPRLSKKDGFINWNSTAGGIHNLVRGCFNWPGAYTYYKGKLLKIYRSLVIEEGDALMSQTPSEIIKVSRDEIVVAAAKGSLSIKELQLEGRRRMTVEEFLGGHKVLPGERLGYEKKVA